MAVQVLLILRGFGVGAAELLEEENWVIAEAAGAAGLICQHAFSKVGDNGEDAALESHRYNTDKARAPVRSFFSIHRAEQFADAIRVGGIGSRVAGGMDPGCTAERRHYQARIIGEDDFGCVAAVICGFSRGILR